MTSNYPPCKALVGSFAVLGFIWLLLVAASHERGQPVPDTAATGKLTAESGEIFSRTKAVGGGDRGGELVHPQWHLNYMSKRRVPNGPDPIHNRRAGNSGRPPGKA